MSIVEWKKDDTVAIMTMNNGENRHNPGFVAAVLKTLDEIERDESIYAVVLASSDEKNWSLGIDLEWIGGAMEKNRLREIKNFMYGLNEMFRRILYFPMPVIAAINGHAFGDGTLLACACDFRFMRSDRGYFCFPEVDISIPFLPAMLAIVKKAIPYYEAQYLILSGKRATAPELEENHVIVKACADGEELMRESLSFARSFTKKRAIFEQHKKRLHKGIVEIMEKEDPEYIEPLNLMV
ncbi:MAG: enoyl-CoA hydratase/isomerase family protein [Deltaproteobacteria bacterium]|nr:enoyl-CoA hydratase/isomerase family protein [Deltaproteobacteria bacterium]